MPRDQLSSLDLGFEEVGEGGGLAASGAGASFGTASGGGAPPLPGLKNLSNPLGGCSQNCFHCWITNSNRGEYLVAAIRLN